MKTIHVLAVVAAASFSAAAWSADYPSKPIRIIVGTSPGSSIDVSARVFADKLGPHARQNVLVENRPGANELIALNAIREAEPDGHTLVWVSSGFTAIPVLVKAAANMDVTREFTPVTLTVLGKLFFFARAGAPFNNPDELIAYMRQNPGKVNYAVGGAGAALLFPTWFKSITKTDFAFVRYPGGAQATQAIAAGEADFMLNFPAAAKAAVDSGRGKLIAYTDMRRHDAFPAVASFADARTPEIRELGQAGFGSVWFGLVANNRTPPAIVSAVYEISQKALKDADLVKRLQAFNMAPIGSKPEEFSALIAREAATWKVVAKEARMEPQ